MSKSGQDNNISKIYINIDNNVLKKMDYITKHRTTYGIVKPNRKVLVESLITREYDKIQEETKRELEWKQRLVKHGANFHNEEIVDSTK